MSTLKVNTIQSNTAGTVTFSEPVAMNSSLTVNGTSTVVEQFTSRSIVDTATTDSSRIAVSDAGVTIAPATSMSSTLTVSGQLTATAGIQVNGGGITVNSGTVSVGTLTATSATVAGVTISPGSNEFLKAWGEIEFVFNSAAPHTTLTSVTKLSPSANFTVALLNGGVNGAFRITLGATQTATAYAVIFQDNHEQQDYTYLVFPIVTSRTLTLVDVAIKNSKNAGWTGIVKFLIPND
jgi:hypothetical protein